MSKQKIEDYYFEHSSTIFSEMPGEDEAYLLSLIHISEPTRPY